MKRWALRPGELKPLGREGLLLLAARCALRAEPWRPPAAARAWTDGLAALVAAARDAPTDARTIAALARTVADHGAVAANRLDATDEPRGRCANYATQALATALDATALADRKALVARTIAVAKLAGSIAAVLAHAGRVPAGPGGDAVDVACAAVWGATRADLAPLTAGLATVAAAKDPVKALRVLAPLWPDGPPAWAAR